MLVKDDLPRGTSPMWRQSLEVSLASGDETYEPEKLPGSWEVIVDAVEAVLSSLLFRCLVFDAWQCQSAAAISPMLPSLVLRLTVITRNTKRGLAYFISFKLPLSVTQHDTEY